MRKQLAAFRCNVHLRWKTVFKSIIWRARLCWPLIYNVAHSTIGSKNKSNHTIAFSKSNPDTGRSDLRRSFQPKKSTAHMKFLHFFLYTEQFWPAWILIHWINSIRIQSEPLTLGVLSAKQLRQGLHPVLRIRIRMFLASRLRIYLLIRGTDTDPAPDPS